MSEHARCSPFFRTTPCSHFVVSLSPSLPLSSSLPLSVTVLHFVAREKFFFSVVSGKIFSLPFVVFFGFSFFFSGSALDLLRLRFF